MPEENQSTPAALTRNSTRLTQGLLTDEHMEVYLDRLFDMFCVDNGAGVVWDDVKKTLNEIYTVGFANGREFEAKQ